MRSVKRVYGHSQVVVGRSVRESISTGSATSSTRECKEKKVGLKARRPGSWDLGIEVYLTRV